VRGVYDAETLAAVTPRTSRALFLARTRSAEASVAPPGTSAWD